MSLKKSLYHYTFNTITYRQSTTKNITVQENDHHYTIPLPSFFKLASSHTGYPKAFCTVHNLIQKSNSITIFWSLGKLLEILFKKCSLKRLESILSTVVRNNYERTSLNNSQSRDPSRMVTPTLHKTLWRVLYKLCGTSYIQHYSFAQRLEWVWLTFQDAKIIALELHTDTVLIQLLKRRNTYSLREGENYNSTSITAYNSRRWPCHFFLPEVRCTCKYTLQIALTLSSQQ